MATNAFLTASSGGIFGAALLASGVYRARVVMDQFNFSDFRMLQVFMVALGAGALAMSTLEKLHYQQRSVRENSTLSRFGRFDGNVLGGALLGAGMALSGACPGTVLVQLAQGTPSAVSTASGALVGALAFVRLGRYLKSDACANPTTQQETLPDATGLSEAVLLAIFGSMVAAAVRYTSAVNGGNSMASPIVGGLFIGSAQAASLLMTGSALGVSTSYEQVGRYIWQVLDEHKIGRPGLPPRAITFAFGMIVGPSVLTRMGLFSSLDMADTVVPAWRAFLGGFVMLFGARTAGGCTSGHGLSGLGALSVSSVVTVAAAFAAGIATTALVGVA